jgi:hypothetical protein
VRTAFAGKGVAGGEIEPLPEPLRPSLPRPFISNIGLAYVDALFVTTEGKRLICL